MSYPSAITLLPPKGHSTRRLTLVILALAPFLFGLLALALGQDANWDLRNYHWYNAYAYVTGRYTADLLPSQTPFFYNPLIDVPFYLLATHAPAIVAGFVLASVQGLNFDLLFMLAYASMIIPNPRHKLGVCLGLSGLGMLGGGGIALLGTTFYDNVTSLGMFASALLVIRCYDLLLYADWRRALLLSFLFGIPPGLMVGLKLPSVVFCVGLCGAVFLTAGVWTRRLAISFAFGVGVLLGLAISLGHWAFFLQIHFGSPLFPYFNNYFHSPLAPDSSARDTQFIPRSLHDFILFPYIFTNSPYRVGEIPWRDLRIPVLYTLLPVALVLRLFFGRSKQGQGAGQSHIALAIPARFLLWFGTLSYVVWLVMFCVYRYAVPLEMLTPLLLVFAVGLLPVTVKTRSLLAAILLVIVAVSIQPGNWYRRASWSAHYMEAIIPPLPLATHPMLLMAGFEPYAHLAAQFPAEIPVVRIQSNFSSPDQHKSINRLLQSKIDAHSGSFFLLIPPWQMNMAKEALPYFHLMLEPEACQTVIDRLYDNKEMALCPVQRYQPSAP